MLNVIEIESFKKEEKGDLLIPKIILDKILEIKSNVIDHILFRGLPISNKLPNSPTEIQDTGNYPKTEKELFKKIIDEIGEISDKSFQNSIRFTLKDGLKNEEPWHNHSQHKYSALYCLYSDPESTSFLESANQIIKNAPKNIKEKLLNPKGFLGEKPFSLIKKVDNGYEFSREIFDHSYLEESIDNLDLPDALKKLDKIKQHEEVKYLIDILNNSSNDFVYQAGDLAIVNESSTIRFSPAYIPKNTKEMDKWLLAASIKK